ncbi:hypothetical protein BC332_30263 [Capsicum chinense]|nr:hypothetical protein BC332_30263 [Capsicum chinense]
MLYGEFPPDIGLNFPELEVLAGGLNKFTGPIPVSLSNASRFTLLDLSGSGLTGTIQAGVGKFQQLYKLNFEFTTPAEYGNMDLKRNLMLDLGFNIIHGTVPDRLGNLENLTRLSLDNNNFRGSVPESLDKLQHLQELELDGNKFSGRVPSWKKTSLEVLNLTGNNLVGYIPKEVACPSSLSVSLHLTRNMLGGPFPLEVGRLKNLKELYLSHNKLTGEIPSTLQTCVRLEHLGISNNLFGGRIPQFFSNASAVSVSRDHKLCAQPIFGLPACSKQRNPSSHIKDGSGAIIGITVSLLDLLLSPFAVSCVLKNPRKRNLASTSSTGQQFGHSFDNDLAI